MEKNERPNEIISSGMDRQNVTGSTAVHISDLNPFQTAFLPFQAIEYLSRIGHHN